MAEAFAHAYGGDVLESASAGLSPFSHIPEETRTVMAEKGISLDAHFPKSFDETEPWSFDYIANMSGAALHGVEPRRVLTWPVRDPYGPDLDLHRSARDRIEALVQQLVLDVRTGREPVSPPAPEPEPLWRRLFKTRGGN